MTDDNYRAGDGAFHRLGTRHGFLAALHDLVKPMTYLEIGVQHGYSLALAHGAVTAIGVDPHPLVGPTGNQVIVPTTSDAWFESLATAGQLPLVDLAFIDGMHLVEYAWRDFVGVERMCHPGAVVVFDDVLPRNQFEARRIPVGEPVVGDWTGDVWKIVGLLQIARPGLTLRLVDVFPTGILVVTGFPDSSELDAAVGTVTSQDEVVPSTILDRYGALAPLVALQQIRAERD